MAQLMVAPFSYFTDANGAPLSGGKVYTYAAGTATPKATYTDESEDFEAANPVVLSSRGIASIWLSGSYFIYVTDSLGNPIGSADWVIANSAVGDMTKTVYDPAAIQEQLVGLTAVQALSNKTLTSPVITGQQMGNQNPLINSNMSVAQRGATFSAITGTTPVRSLDGWFGWADGAAAMAITQQTAVAASGFNYSLRVQRPNGNTSVVAHRVGQVIETRDSYRFAGKTCVLSFYAKCGSNFSATSNALIVRAEQGTGADQGASSLTAATWTGITLALNTTQNITTTLTRYSKTFTMASNTTEISVEFGFTPTGTASTNDYFEITGVQLETDTLTDYIHIPYADTLERCLRFYEKSFNYATAPAQNAGLNIGEFFFPATKVAALTNYFLIPFAVKKRVAPTTITTYNPSATNAQARDLVVPGDCSGIGTTAMENGIAATVVGHASTAVGNKIAVHWTAEADL